MPISIVLSVYVFLFAKAALYYLYNILNELLFAASQKAINGLDSETFVGSFMSVQNWTIYSVSNTIFMFIVIFLAYTILFNFHDRILHYFGHEGENGITKYANSAFEGIKHKIAAKV